MGRLLSPQRLAAIARRWEANLDCTAIVLPQTQLAGPGGITELSYPEPDVVGLTSYRCRIQSASAPDEGTVADQERSKMWWKVTLPVVSRLRPTDRLYVSGSDAKGNRWTRTIEVTGAQGPRTWEARREVLGWEVLPDSPTVQL